jgi:hypothetical protein
MMKVEYELGKLKKGRRSFAKTEIRTPNFKRRVRPKAIYATLSAVGISMVKQCFITERARSSTRVRIWDFR